MSWTECGAIIGVRSHDLLTITRAVTKSPADPVRWPFGQWRHVVAGTVLLRHGSTPMAKRDSTKKPLTTDVLPWHKPACDTCGEPIETTEGAWVCWQSDGGNRYHSPRVVHHVTEKDGCHVDGERVEDHHLAYFRRSPAQVVDVALSGVAYKPDSKDTWLRWVMTVLGLPMFNSTEAAVYGDAPKILPDSVTHDRFRVVEHGRVDSPK